jgi:hypothetical protein
MATTNRRLIAYIGSSIYHDNNEGEFAGNSLVDAAYPVADRPAATFAVMEDANGDDTLYVADGENILKKWYFGATAEYFVPVTGAPKASIITVAKNRSWANDIDNPRVAYFSELRNGDGWDTVGATTDEEDAGFIYMNDLPDGEGITNISVLHGNRYVASQNGIVEISGDTPYLGLSADVNARPFLVRPISNQIGMASGRCFVNIGADGLFMSRRGVHSLAATDKFGDVEDKYVSAPIQSMFASLNKDLFWRTQGVNYRRKNLAIWNVSRDIDEGKMKTLIVFDYAQNVWSIWTFDYEILCLHTRVNPDTRQEELLAGSDRGHVYVLDQDTRTDDDGTTDYTFTIKSSWIHDGDPASLQKFSRLVTHLTSADVGTLTGQYWVDNHGPFSFTIGQNPYSSAIIGDFVIGTDTIGGAGFPPPSEETVLNKRGKKYQVEYTCATGNAAIAGAEVWIVPGGRGPDK